MPLRTCTCAPQCTTPSALELAPVRTREPQPNLSIANLCALQADLSYKEVMAAGIMAGFGLWGSMFPLDTIKSKMQVGVGVRLGPPLVRGAGELTGQSPKKERRGRQGTPAHHYLPSPPLPSPALLCPSVPCRATP